MSTHLAETRAETRRETGGTLAGCGGTSTYARGSGVSANRHTPLGVAVAAMMVGVRMNGTMPNRVPKQSPNVWPMLRRSTHLSQSELASLIGSSRESVARAFLRLRQLDLVETSRRSVVLRDVTQLERFAR